MVKARLEASWRRVTIFLLFRLIIFNQTCCAFVPAARTHFAARTIALRASSDDNNNDAHLDDLKPPLINWRRESILFGTSPATQKNNNALRLWRHLKSTLPPLITGAYRKTTADENPIGALFNMLFIRMPILAAGVLYIVNQVNGHPLVMDVGSGPFEVNPVLVAGVLYLMLL